MLRINMEVFSPAFPAYMQEKTWMTYLQDDFVAPASIKIDNHGRRQ